MSTLSSLGQVILASASPARLQVLRQAGVDAISMPTDADEHCLLTEAGAVVEELASRKMAAFRQAHPDCMGPAITCDTLISFKGRLIGKPRDRQEAFEQLSAFSGQTHEVFSGYNLLLNGQLICGHDRAQVTFRVLPEKQINDYLDSGEYIGAAGSYRIQGQASRFILSIDGDTDTVIGIPMKKLEELVSGLRERSSAPQK